MKQPKTITKTGSNSEEFEVDNPDYNLKKRNPMKHLTPKKKKRK